MAGLIHWDPFRSLRRRDDVFEDLFRDVVNRAAPDDGFLQPAIEVAETADAITVKMQVPGVEKDQLQLSVADDALTVRGEVRKETEDKKKNYFRQEISYGSFQRTVPLPVEVDAAKAKAELKNGQLAVTLPKSAQPKARDIKVEVH